MYKADQELFNRHPQPSWVDPVGVNITLGA